MKKYNIAIIGAGNGGHALAGHFSILGHRVTLYNRSLDRLEHILDTKEIELTEAIQGIGSIYQITDDIEVALRDNEVLMIATTANAHRDLAELMIPYFKDGHIVVLNPGRTGGALEFKFILDKYKVKQRVYIAEAQSLIYACRVIEPGVVRIVGVKEKVLLSALPSSDSDYVTTILNEIYPCFEKTESVLRTSLENIGAIFHPAIVIFNSASIERGQDFFFYNDITPKIAKFLELVDSERLEIGKSFGMKLIPATDWISYAYPNIEGDDLCTRMKNNPAYSKITAPQTLNSRMLLEDIPMGVLPLIEFAKITDVKTPLLQSLFEISQALLCEDFIKNGRTLQSMGLDKLTKDEILNSIN